MFIAGQSVLGRQFSLELKRERSAMKRAMLLLMHDSPELFAQTLLVPVA